MDKILYSPGEAVSRVFTTRNPATGAATAATGTPTAVLYRNKVATAVTVTVALITSNLYSLDFTLPSGGSAYTVGDDIFIYLSATIAGVADSAILFEGKIGYQVTRDTSGRVQVQSGTSTGQIALSSGAVTAGTVIDKTGYSLSVTPPTAAATATAVRSELTTELGRIDAAVSTRSTYAGGDTSGVTTLLTRVPDGAIAAVKVQTDKLTDVTASQLEIALKQFTNRVTVASNVLTVYDDDGTTILESFTLTPISGNAGYSERTP